LDDHGMVEKPVQECGGDDGIAEHLRMPPFSIGSCLRSRLRMRGIRCFAKGLRLPTSALAAAPLSWLSGCPMDASGRSG
jgi:hypothetical protein